MKSNTNRSDFLMFERVAAFYDSGRPTYPLELIDAVMEYANASDGSTAVEIGAGSGQATKVFAARGLRITALEPGESLARLARLNLSAFSSVSIVQTTFEVWQPPTEKFDMVLSANAFHWLDPAVSYAKCRIVLRPAGTLATFWNFPSLPMQVYQCLEDLWGSLNRPQLSLFNPQQDLNELIASGIEEINSSKCFGDIKESWISDSQLISVDRLESLLRTYANFARLKPKERDDVLRRAKERIVTSFGDTLELSNRFYLRLARAI